MNTTNAEPVVPKITVPPPPAPSHKMVKDDDEAAAAKYAEEIRARRGDIRQMESRLTFVGDRPGWTRRWCNDEGDNIARRLEDGWRFVQRQEVKLSESVGYGNQDLGNNVTITSRIGTDAIKVHLMEIPTVIAEDLLNARSYKQVRLIEESILAGSVGNPSMAYNPGERPGSHFHGTNNSIGRPS